MLNESGFPHIKTAFDRPDDHSSGAIYRQVIRCQLEKVLPESCFRSSESGLTTLTWKEKLAFLLPRVVWKPIDDDPTKISFFAVARSRSGAFKLFYDLISRWLVPGTSLDVMLIYSVDFSFPEISDETFTLYEMMIHVHSEDHRLQIQKNFPTIETELCLGLESSLHARKILEVKGSVIEEKIAHAQDYISYLIRRMPQSFDTDVFTEMQQVLLSCSEEFKDQRDCRHLSRLVCIHYLFRKQLETRVERNPKKRHLLFKVFRAQIQRDKQRKKVLGIILGLSFLQEKEVFEERHLIQAVQSVLNNVELVENTFYIRRNRSQNVGLLYVEIQRTDGKEISGEEIQQLRNQLHGEIVHRVERLLPPIFMPRNDEEIMRNIFTLSEELKYVKDQPQVIITFDEQSHNHLYFTLIWVQVKREGEDSLKERFQASDSTMTYIHDRVSHVGTLRKKYAKEATVFRMKMNKEEFIREDSSIDLYKARQDVAKEIQRVLGAFRDFNGGMMTKESECLLSLKHLLDKERHRYNDWLLENFFYSIAPMTMRAVFEPKALKDLFVMMLEAQNQAHRRGIEEDSRTLTIDNAIFMMITTPHIELLDQLNQTVQPYHQRAKNVACTSVKNDNRYYIGYVYQTKNQVERQEFMETILTAIAKWRHLHRTSTISFEHEVHEEQEFSQIESLELMKDVQ
ncbi:MAG: hypothetical protein KDK65_00670 [Chlamydiia bacterium]|nr:hypothetical protein [Chlamydiia bacterium]